jgi:hypothetical protein
VNQGHQALLNSDDAEYKVSPLDKKEFHNKKITCDCPVIAPAILAMTGSLVYKKKNGN